MTTTRGQQQQQQVQEPIAMVGSGCRFPGGASTPAKLWEVLREPRDLLTPIPDSRFCAPGFFHEDGDHHGHSNVLHSYLLSEDHTAWDADFFRTPAAEASAIDPQQRLLMECVYEALEAGGHRVHDLRGSDTAVFVGLVCEEYSDIHYRELNAIPRYFPTGTARSIASNRISYFFDWRGPSMTIDTACSSSLVAVNQAVQALRSGVSKMAVAAGVQLILGPEPYIVESTFHMLSPSGRCRMWDASADGYGRGDGIAAVVLKTLSQALADGDRIECIIREIGVNQDGGVTSGITVPNPDAQIALIRDTYRRAGLDLDVQTDRPQFFECHGTGTPTGDPLEATAIHEALTRGRPRQQEGGPPPLYVGSIKTVIGHTEATAGIAGLLKASLAVQNGLIPPNLLFDKLSPAIQPLYTGLEVLVGEAMPWPQVATRRVSVNSFGFGGTNAHAIVENYQAQESVYFDEQRCFIEESPQPPLPYTFSATTKTSLQRMLADFADFLETAQASIPNQHAVAFTLNARRSLLPARAVFAARGLVDLKHRIRDALGDSMWEPAGVVLDDTEGKEARPLRILGVFAGQGAQWAGMARHLVQDVPFVAQRLAELDVVLANLPAKDRPLWSLGEELARVQGSRLHLAEFAQPLCTALQIIQVDLLAAANIHFAAVVGHSSGEIAAAYAAGVLSARDALVVAYYRGLCCSRSTTAAANSNKGAMMAVGSSITDMRELVSSAQFQDRICVAAHNSPNSVTLSGDEDAILEAKEMLACAGKFVRLLRVDQAYHSHHMQRHVDSYIQGLAKAGVRANDTWSPNRTKAKQEKHKAIWYSSVFGPDHPYHCISKAVITSAEADEHILPRQLDGPYWALNMRQTVLFADAVEAAVSGSADSLSMAISIGAHGALRAPLDEVLTTLRGKVLPYASALTRNTDDSLSLLKAIGEVWARSSGSSIDLGQFQTTVHGVLRQQLIPLQDLPSYPWDHSRTFWHESRRSRALRTRPSPAHPLLGTLSPDSMPTDLAWHNHLRVADLPWLRGHRLQGQIVYPAAAYMVSVLHAALHVASRRQKKASKVELRNMVIGKAIVLEDEGADGVELVTTLHLADGASESHDDEDDDTVHGVFRFRSLPLGSSSTDAPLHASGSVVMTLVDVNTDHTNTPGDNQDHRDEPLLVPRQGSSPALLVGVGEGSFYMALDALGYQYTDSFRSLFLATRKLGYAQAALALPVLQAMSRSERDLLLFPSTLDALFQAIFLAYAWPGDGRLWSMHVPVAVDRIQIDVEQVRKHPQDYAIDAQITMDPSVSGRPQDGLGGDVWIYSNSNTVTTINNTVLVQAEGVRLAPLAIATSSEDTQMFLQNVDGVASPDCTLAMSTNLQADGSWLVDRATEQETELGWLLERIAHFYLARLAHGIKPHEEVRAEWHHKKLMNYARHATREVAAGRTRFAHAEWARDVDEGGEGQQELYRLMEARMDKIDVQLMRSVGEHLPAAVRGETAILQHMVQDGMLNRSYEETLGVKSYSVFLAAVMQQITHVYPAASILEIGAGTGGATKRILERIEPHAFRHYTFTDVSTGFFEAAETIFAAQVHSGRMSFRMLDIERDPVAHQGFEAYAYDVVLASFVLHATTDLEHTLRNARRLLRPGGLLVLLEMTSNDTMRLSMTMGGLPGWWLGADTGRPWSPCVSTAEWHALLQRAGFTGVEQSTPELDPLARPFSVLVSRALDDRIRLLMEPSAQSPTELSSLCPINELLVLAGSQLSSIRLGEHVARILQPFVQGPATILSNGMEGFLRFTQQQESRNLTVLYLADIDDHPLLEGIQPQAFDGLKKLFASSPDQVLWVTRGAQAGERPYAAASIGLGRALMMEYPQVTMQFLDFSQEPAARTLADDVLRLRLLRGIEPRQRQQSQGEEKVVDVLWSREVEMAVDRQGRRWISRILPHRHFNNSYNSARRVIFSSIHPAHDHIQIYDEFPEKGPSIRSVVRLMPGNNGKNDNIIQVRPYLSVPLAVQEADLGFHFDKPKGHRQAGRTWAVSIGSSPSAAATDAPSSSILLSDHLGSLISPITKDCLVPLDPKLENAPSMLSTVANSLVASLIAREAERKYRSSQGTINRLVLADPDIYLAREVLARSKTASSSWTVISLTTSRAKHSIASDIFTLVDVTWGKRTIRTSLSRALGISLLNPVSSGWRIGTIVTASDATRYSQGASSLAKLAQSAVPELARANIRSIGDLIQRAHDTPSDFSSSSDPATRTATTVLATTFCQVVQDARSCVLDYGDKATMCLISLQDYTEMQHATTTTPPTQGANVIVDWSAANQQLIAVARPLDGLSNYLLRSDRTYLLLGLGGKGGLGSSLAEYLVQQGARHIVLTSRNPGVEAKLIETYAQQGVRIQAIANDITHEASLRTLIAGLAASPNWPPIGGVANGAMVLADVSLQNMTYDEMVRVLRPKIDGTILIDKLFERDSLDFFILFSSLSCVLGNRGQANYDAANMFLVGLAAQRRARGVVASVVDIGAIMGTGYMAREVREQMLKQMVGAGFLKMSERDFYMAFSHGILAGRSPASSKSYEVITGLYVPPASDEFQPAWVSNPRFSHMVAKSRVSAAEQTLAYGSSSSSSKFPLPAETTQQLLQRARTLSDISRVVSKAVVKKMTHILQLSGEVARDHAALLQRGTSALGVDSLVAVEIRAWMLREFEVDMPVFKILADNSLRDLVEFAVAAMPHLVTPNLDRDSTEDAICAEDLESGRKAPIEHGNNTFKREPVVSTPPQANETVDSSSPSSSLLLSSSALETASVTSNDDVVTSQPAKPSTNNLTPIEKSLAMSHGQSRFWFMSQLSPNPMACNVVNDIEIKAELDKTALSCVVEMLGARHEALRTAFRQSCNTAESDDEDDKIPKQVVLKDSPLRLDTITASGPSEVDEHFYRLQNTVYSLDTGDLIKMVLISLSPHVHHLLIGYHHINMDSASMAILVDEMLRLYDGQILPPPQLQQADFAIHQQRQLEGGHWAEQITFWRDELATSTGHLEPLPVLALSPSSISRTRPDRITYRSNTSQKTRVSSRTAKNVQALCRRAGVTAFHLYTTVFQVLLGRLMRHPVDRVIIGMADANRNSDCLRTGAGAERIVGNCLNILPLLLDMPIDHQCVDSVLKKTRDRILLAMRHSSVPFETILEQAQVPRSQSHNPIFQAFIDYKRVAEKLAMLGDRGEVEGQRYLLSKTPYDVTLDIIDTPQGDALLELHVQDGLYTKEEVQTLSGLFVHLLDSFARSEPGAKMGEVNMFDPAEVDKALRLGQGETIPLQQGSIVPRLYAIADAMTDAASALEDHDGITTLTWSQLKRKSEAVAHALKSLGITPGARVAVFQESTVDWVCTILGIWRIGASYVPLEVAQGFERLGEIAKAARIAAVVAHDKTRDEIPKLELEPTIPVINVSSLAMLAPDKPTSPGWMHPVVTGEEEAIVLYTSGSTGVPKGISVPHRVVTNAIDGMLRKWPELNTQPQVVLQQAALSFDFSWWTVLLGLCTKGTVVVVNRDARRDPRQLTQLIVRRGITFTVATPSETVAWLQSHDPAALRACQWRWHVAGGEAFSLSLMRYLFLLHKPSLRVLNAYGPAETWMPLSHEVAYQDATTQDQIDKLWPVPLGTVMPNYTVCVVDAGGRVLPAEMPGQVVIGGAGVAREYVDQPALTAQRFVPRARDHHITATPTSLQSAPGLGDDMVHLSGDCGYLRAEDGKFMMLGRIDGDTQVKLRGLRIDLREIESSILAQAQGQISDAVVSIKDVSAAVAAAAYASVNREEGEETSRFLAAHVILSPAAKAEYGIESERVEFLRAISQKLPLPDYMRPTIMVPVNALPLTPNGKLDRKAIRAWRVRLNPPTFQVHNNTVEQPSPRTNNESSNICGVEDNVGRMRQIWGYALGCKANLELEGLLGPQADFFHIGGNSILLTRVQSRLRSQYGVDVPLRTLFHGSTLGQMALLLVEGKKFLSQDEGGHARIEWQEEIELPCGVHSIPLPQKMEEDQSDQTMPGRLVVALTGATGFLGRHLVQQLLDRSEVVGEVHCLAVRNEAPLARFVDAAVRTNIDKNSDKASKLFVHRGDLARPGLGMEDASKLKSVFTAAQVLIHNGADTSFLKSYEALRPINVNSLKELMKLTIDHRGPQRAAHIHFVSTAGVATFLGRDLGEESLGRLPPPHITEGYLLTKWVGELLLETFGCGTVHRPTAISGPGAPELDVVSSVMRYSAQLGAVPALEGYDGSLQFIAVEEVARGIVNNAVMGAGACGSASGVQYRNHCGNAEEAVELCQLGAYLAAKLGRSTALPVLRDDEWIAQAEAIGFPKLLGEYLRADTVGGRKRKTFRKLLRDG